MKWKVSVTVTKEIEAKDRKTAEQMFAYEILTLRMSGGSLWTPSDEYVAVPGPIAIAARPQVNDTRPLITDVSARQMRRRR